MKIYNLNVRGPLCDLPTTRSKLLYPVMTFDDVLLRPAVQFMAKPRIVSRLIICKGKCLAAPL